MTSNQTVAPQRNNTKKLLQCKSFMPLNQFNTAEQTTRQIE